MRRTIQIAPLTRVEGHLDLEITVDTVDRKDQVVAAKASGTMLRAFEAILIKRDPLDAAQYTQRICGVCPTSHGMAASLALEAAYESPATRNGRVLRNLVLGADFLQSHILHFYHLAALDYVDTVGALDTGPWLPRFTVPGLLKGGEAARLIDHYVRALATRRTAHQMGAIFGGKLPSSPAFIHGGFTETASRESIAEFRRLLHGIRAFLDEDYLPDVRLIAGRFPEYASLGRGCGNLLAFGGFDLDAQGTRKLFPRGRFTDGALGSLDAGLIAESVRYSWYSDSGAAKSPSMGVTEPHSSKPDAYSWIKAPRYANRVHETGPLARLWVSGDYRDSLSVVGRLMARALEAKKIALAMDGWLGELEPGAPSRAAVRQRDAASGAGLTEAPRGALGHWLDIRSSRISRYQIVTPTAWNASPKDDAGQPGPIEQALIGAPVADPEQPVEVLRIVRSFDPCLACAVHVARPGRTKATVILGA